MSAASLLDGGRVLFLPLRGTGDLQGTLGCCDKGRVVPGSLGLACYPGLHFPAAFEAWLFSFSMDTAADRALQCAF